MRLFLLPLFLAACGGLPDEVILEGVVLDQPVDGAPLAGAALEVRDEAGALYDSGKADPSGVFELAAPAGDVIFVDVTAPGFVRTAHTGVAGLQDRQIVEPGSLYGMSEAFLAEWEARFAGCPGIGEGGAVFGEVRIWDVVEPGTDIHPLVKTAVVTLEDDAGKTWKACYLDDAGEAVDPEAQWTGSSGRFAIFGVPEGLVRLRILYEYAPGRWTPPTDYPVRVPGQGVAPRFPAFVELVL